MKEHIPPLLYPPLRRVGQTYPVVQDLPFAGSSDCVYSDESTNLCCLAYYIYIVLVVLQKLLLHFAELDSVEVDVVELENAVNQRILFFEQQLGSTENVENYFDKSISELIDELKPIIKNQTLIQKMQYEITKNVQVSPSEVEAFYNAFHVDSLPIIDAQFRVSQILKIPEAANLAIEETLSKLEDLRNRILKGADFATMAILYSEDPGSSRNGGAYYAVKKGQFVKEFESVAFSLSFDELSEIFQTEYGYHICQLIDRKGGEIDIRHILMTPKISTKDLLGAKSFLDSLKQEINNNEVTFEIAANEFSSDKNTRYNGWLLINSNGEGLNRYKYFNLFCMTSK